MTSPVGKGGRDTLDEDARSLEGSCTKSELARSVVLLMRKLSASEAAAFDTRGEGDESQSPCPMCGCRLYRESGPCAGEIEQAALSRQGGGGVREKPKSGCTCGIGSSPHSCS